MISDTLRGGLLICLINLVVVMAVLGIIAWAIGLVPRLLRRLERGEHPESEVIGSPDAFQLETETPFAEEPVGVEAEAEPGTEPEPAPERASQADEDSTRSVQYVELPLDDSEPPRGGR